MGGAMSESKYVLAAADGTSHDLPHSGALR
jgi:hypothetical protein